MRKLIIFDLDGTLVDTRDFILRALHDLAGEFKYKVPNESDIAELRNTRSIHFLKVLGVPMWKGPRLIKCVQKMLSQEIKNMELVPGLSDTLLDLKKQGHVLGVITSNSQENMNLFFEKYHGVYFDTKSADVFVFGKGRALKKLAKRRGVALSDTYYIGDETRDILAAHAAGVKVVAVSWGFNTRAILEEMQPDFVADTPLDLLNYFKNDS